MLISEVKPINEFGKNLLRSGMSKKSIDEFIEANVELPLQKACKLFFSKGIETVMSSANKNNLLKSGEKPIEKEDVRGQEWFLDRPTFDTAGKGYAWIMLNFDTLSDENKDMLFHFEEKTDKNGNKVGEKIVWFVQPCQVGNIAYKVKTGQFTKEFLASALSEYEMRLYKDLEVDERLAEFDRRRIVLGYNNRYPINSVMIRMPINDKTTVEEVEEFFAKLTELFRSQRELGEVGEERV